jgi:peroxiredoxin
MIELGELEERAADFRARGVRMICVSLDDRDGAGEAQRRFPSLTVLADARRDLAGSLQLLHRGAGPGGIDGFAPTTILVDGDGVVRWVHRPANLADRLSPDELLAAIDLHLGG